LFIDIAVRCHADLVADGIQFGQCISELLEQRCLVCYLRVKIVEQRLNLISELQDTRNLSYL
jgi:hypothetical protein